MVETLTQNPPHDSVAAEPSPAQIVNEWLSSFEEALASSTDRPDRVLSHFHDERWWRDAISLTWDFRTVHTDREIASFVEGLPPASLQNLRTASDVAITTATDPVGLIEAYFDFDVEAGTGRGIVRLTLGDDGWKAWTLLTALDELRGHERPLGHRRQQVEDPTKSLWHEERERLTDMVDIDPDVIVIGAGQAGLGLAAELRMLGLNALVVERSERVGDSWRKRYPSLVLHDPVWADHMPYMPFPEFWPTYTPKEKLAGWLEYYATAMELNVWTSSELVNSSYDDTTGLWTAEIRRADNVRILSTPHIVMATGQLGKPRLPELPHVERFQGTAIHSSAFAGGKDRRGIRAVVVGASSSGHDIAADLLAYGADVTMVQRSSIYVMSQKNGIPALFGQVYYQDGPPLDQSDLRMLSYPINMTLAAAPAQTEAIAEADRDLLDGLKAAGFLLDMGIDGGGLMSKALRTGGGYYIDVGTSSLIAEGRIKVHSGAGLAEFTESGILLDDGAELPADLVILATGYDKMPQMIEDMFGAEAASRCGEPFGLDEEGEISGFWRPSGHPGLWFAGGSLMFVRLYAKYLALQLKAIKLGINPRADQTG